MKRHEVHARIEAPMRRRLQALCDKRNISVQRAIRGMIRFTCSLGETGQALALSQRPLDHTAFVQAITELWPEGAAQVRPATPKK